MNKFNPQELISERKDCGRGSFESVARVSQQAKSLVRMFGSYVSDVEREALDNIATKIARIVTRSNRFDIDSWRDIAGYATLIVNHIESEEKSDDNYVES